MPASKAAPERAAAPASKAAPARAAAPAPERTPAPARTAAPEPVLWSATQEIPVFNPLPAIPTQQGHDKPVFVDVSGRRGKKLRRLGWLCGLAATGFAVALVGSLLGGNSRAPGLTLPDATKDDAVTAPPRATASQVPQPKQSPKKLVVPSHGVSKAPASKTVKPSKASHGATPVTGHSPVNTKVSPRPSASKKPVTRAVTPTAAKTGA
ncbi:hypothetical protein DWB77_04735 [Streptomyces hundungensis]|uniref:Uncharacterized protein n=1 Tax=Streptomyces hundungensis TaxID=1077946 RepID=A0A387HFF5_9ACTN|nr:hypothetical protein [Streptomyces hundungensis]AYG82555.1 hypothetical protein DWB77_04735 [Streptomyces hundungensis]